MRPLADGAPWPRHAVILAGVGLLAAALLAVAAGTAAPARDASTVGASGTTALRVYLDPATGAFVPPPAGTTLPAPARALGAAAPALVETPGASAAGGVTIDLRGSFQSALTATVDVDGAVRTSCAPAPPGPPR
jgi:hypothetical protein